MPVLFFFCQFRCLISSDQGVDQLVQIAVEIFFQAVQSQSDPVIGQTALREVIGANSFGAVAGSDRDFRSDAIF